MKKTARLLSRLVKGSWGSNSSSCRNRRSLSRYRTPASTVCVCGKASLPVIRARLALFCVPTGMWASLHQGEGVLCPSEEAMAFRSGLCGRPNSLSLACGCSSMRKSIVICGVTVLQLVILVCGEVGDDSNGARRSLHGAFAGSWLQYRDMRGRGAHAACASCRRKLHCAIEKIIGIFENTLDNVLCCMVNSMLVLLLLS